MIWLTNYFSPQEYVFNPHAVPAFFVSLFAILLTIFVISIERKNRNMFPLNWLCLALVFWLVPQGLMLCSRYPGGAFFWSKVFYVGVALFAAVFTNGVYQWTNATKDNRFFIIVMYALAGLFAALLWTGTVVGNVSAYPFGYFPVAGDLHVFFVLYIVLTAVMSAAFLAGVPIRVTDKVERRKAAGLALGFILLCGAYTDLFLGTEFVVYPLSPFFLFVTTLLVTGVLVRYHLFYMMLRSDELETQLRDLRHDVSRLNQERTLTQLKLMEASKVSAVASLSSGILHQLSQPVTAIHGFARFIKGEIKPDNEFYKPVIHIEEQSVYIKEMLEDLMELIRHKEIVRAHVDVNDIVNKALHLLHDELRIKRVNWDVDLVEGMPRIYADAVHLQQVFMNIIVNSFEALAHQPKGRPRELMISSSVSENGHWVVVTFKDNGPGLPEEQRAQVFEPFYTTKSSGVGIGLALCYDLVTEHGGTIHIDSISGKGTEFIVSFPVQDGMKKEG